MEGTGHAPLLQCLSDLPPLPPRAAGHSGNFPGSGGLDVWVVCWIWELFMVFDDNFSQGRFC